MKYWKEIRAGLIAIISIVVLFAGINFLKGNSFFGGDSEFHAYFPDTGQLMVSNNVTVNGVIVGHITNIEYVPNNPESKKVKVTFNIQNKDVKIPKLSYCEIGSLDLFSKGMLLHLGSDLSKGYLKPGDEVRGILSVDMISQVKAYADPISQKVQGIMSSVDEMVNSLSAFWDSTATSEIQGSLYEVKVAIKKLGNAADQIEGLVGEGKVKLDRIMSNVESITSNLKRSNDDVQAIIGNTKKLTDDILTSEYKETITEAKNTLKNFNTMLVDVKTGSGTITKLIYDDSLYTELVNTNTELQNLLIDLQQNPHRYIHMSVFGSKVRGVDLNKRDEIKLQKILDSIPE
ncbi:MAG: MlaD family protein [Crocinitomicaceae bacterium]|nr:MlaD family protein [Crocinitomicaceae bacterium]